MKKKTNTRPHRSATNATANGSTGHLERINAQLKWWGAPVIDFSNNESQLRCLQEFTDGIQNLYRDASSRQRHLLDEAGRDFSSGIAHLAWPRMPSELLGVQSVMAAKPLDGMSHQSRFWIDMAEGFVDRYAAFAKGTAELCHRQPDKGEKMAR